MKFRIAAFALLSTVLLAGVARAQTIDETISYLNQYGSNFANGSWGGVEGEYVVTESKPFSFKHPTTLVYRMKYCRNPPLSETFCIYPDTDDGAIQIDMSQITRITRTMPYPNSVFMDCPTECVYNPLTHTSMVNGVTIPPQNKAWRNVLLYCGDSVKCDRMERALKHLKSLVGDDPFAQ